MDLSFSRRNFQSAALDLATLLARISAAQTATQTARAQLLLDRRPGRLGDEDARIALFGNPSAIDTQAPTASFAALFSPRQPK